MGSKAKPERWFVVADYPTGVLGGDPKKGGRVVPGHHIKVDDPAQTPVTVVLSMGTTPKAAQERRRMADLIAEAPEMRDLLIELLNGTEADRAPLKDCKFDHTGCTTHGTFAFIPRDDGSPFKMRCPYGDGVKLIQRLGARKGRRVA